jgi:hypothetical protein
MSHDPAIHISELGRSDDMRSTVVMGIGDHTQCDILLVRVSGAPVEVGCPGVKNAQCYGHREIEWLDADVIRLLYYTEEDKRPEVRTLKRRHIFRCWTSERLTRLRYVLEVE